MFILAKVKFYSMDTQVGQIKDFHVEDKKH